MKHILAALTIALMLVNPAWAQDATYLDTLDATGITSATILTRGYDVYIYSHEDVNAYQLRTVSFWNLAITDSVKLQGAHLNRTRDVADTQWIDIELTQAITASSSPGAGGYGSTRDTTYAWYSSVGRDIGTISPVFTVPFGYDLYRVISGKLDSGVVYVRWMCWGDGYGEALPGPSFAPTERLTWDYNAVYFDRQRA